MGVTDCHDMTLAVKMALNTNAINQLTIQPFRFIWLLDVKHFTETISLVDHGYVLNPLCQTMPDIGSVFCEKGT